VHGYQIVARSLADAGVTTVFGVAGDANLYIVDDLVRSHGVRYVAAAHEAAATMMAVGYSRVRGEVGVATTTHGPGLTNTTTALVEGVRSRTPMVLLAGDTDPALANHPQSIDQRRLVEATGAGFEHVGALAVAPEAISRALWRASSERRPVVVNVASQLQWAEGDYEPFSRPWPTAHRTAPDPEVLDRALGVMASSIRPLVLAGRGAIDAREPLLRLAERLGAPVATTVLASNLFRGDPFDLGIFGTLSHPVAAEAIAEADCIVAFGASLNTYTTDAGTLLRDKQVVQCDLTAAAFGALPQGAIAVVADAGRTAETMLEWLDELDHKPSGFRSDALRDRLAVRGWRGSHTDRSTDDTIDPRTFTEALDEILPSERTVAIDVGRFMLHGLTVPVPEPAALVTTHGFQSIGLGPAAAVGAGVARPDRPTVLLVGDGGFMMAGLAEFQAAVRAGVDLIAIVYNDGSYGAEHVQFQRKGMDPALSLNDWPDLASVAQALGGDGVRVRRVGDLPALAEAVGSRRRPLLVDVSLDPELLSSLMG
jgi:acetolactate synthase I/II/III large subunit